MYLKTASGRTRPGGLNPSNVGRPPKWSLGTSGDSKTSQVSMQKERTRPHWQPSKTSTEADQGVATPQKRIVPGESRPRKSFRTGIIDFNNHQRLWHKPSICSRCPGDQKLSLQDPFHEERSLEPLQLRPNPSSSTMLATLHLHRVRA